MTARRIGSLLAFAAGLLAIPTAAQAQTTLGQLAPGTSPSALCAGASDIVALRFPSGPGYEVPSAGVITSWSTNAAAGAGQETTFKLVRPLDARNFLVVAHDGPRQLVPSAVNTFETAIPVQRGDLLALSTTNGAVVPGACVFATPGSGDRIAEADAAVADGGVTHISGDSAADLRLNVRATLLGTPTITGVSPASGPFRGGTAVTITGSEFAHVTNVSFGLAAAFLFTVDSETQITAIAPGLTPIRPTPSVEAPITVTTIAGAAFAPGRFFYRGCHSPKLVGRTLRAAKTLLGKAGCRLGRVKRSFGLTAKVNKVVRQRPKAGKQLAPGARVNLTVVDRPADI